MPIENFEGKTFVAFLDISGFKDLMKNNDKVIKALDKFYSSGYRVLQKNPNLNGIFISDSGIIFAKNNKEIASVFFELLDAIREINSEILAIDVMLTTAVAYGDFTYRNKIVFPGIEKNAIHGNAYVNAYLANEKGEPKMEPGEVRIISENLPIKICDAISQGSRWIIKKQGEKYYSFYWMLNSEEKVKKFSDDFKGTYKRKYAGMLSVLKKYNRDNRG